MIKKAKIVRKNRDGELEINWVCLKEKCPQNCCGHFEDKLPSCVSLENIKHDEILLLSDEVIKYNKKNLANNIARISDDSYIKLTRKDRSCPFLVDGQCSHYEHRPHLCKAYPFYIDLFSGINMDLSCPGVGKGWTKLSNIRKNVKSLTKIYKKHIKDVEKKYA